MKNVSPTKEEFTTDNRKEEIREEIRIRNEIAMKREKMAGIWKGEMSGSLDQATEARKAISGGVANPQTTKSWKPSVPEKISAARCACACAFDD